MPQAKIGVIGGTGLYEIEGLTDIKEAHIDTPFGDTSDHIIMGKLNGVGIAFLPRHGRGHRILANEVPARANIYALKSLGVEHIIAINSCGSFKEELRPGELLIPDQAIDLTKSRPSTFFGNGIAAHISMADPFCQVLSRILYDCAQEAGAKVHSGGTYICMEGPAFSTRAESLLYKSWNADVIGMTIFPEAKLAREAEICYASICCITDYDCWKAEHVTADIVTAIMQKNIALSKQIIKMAVSRVPVKRECECAVALKTSILTNPAVLALDKKRRLDLLIGKYISK